MELENVRAMSSDISGGPSVGGQTGAHPQELESVLAGLQEQGWRVLRDPAEPVVSGQALSFVLVGPGGIVVMETGDRFCRRARGAAFLAAPGFLAASLPAEYRTRVRSVLVLLGGAHDIVARCTVPATVDTVSVAALARWLEGGGTRELAAEDVDVVVGLVGAALSGRGGRLLSTDEVPPLDACIPEATLTRRGDRRRLRRARMAPSSSRRRRPELTLTDVFRVMLATLAVVALLYFVGAMGSAGDPDIGGVDDETPVTSTMVDGSHGQPRPSAAQAAAP